MISNTPHRPSPSELISVVFRRGGPQRTLHLTWIAFFLSFVVWFNFAPFATDIGKQFGLDKGQLVTLGLCNLALTVPARLIIGGVLDRFGPRKTFSGILIFALFPCLLFATAQSFTMLLISRLLVSVVGAGFVVGIRMVAEWFPPTEVGTAEGVYGGWGNFGAAASAIVLPIIAGIAGGEEGWRWAAALTGIAAAAYGIAYSKLVSDTPAGVPYARAKSAAALEVTNHKAVFGLMAMFVPAAVALGVIVWRVRRVDVIGTTAMIIGFGLTALFLIYQINAVRRVNRQALTATYPADQQYPFRSVVVLSLAYFCTFGSELAAVSYLPQFFESTWGLSTALAGAAASAFAFMNLVSRPAGGFISDLVQSRKRWLAVLVGGLGVGYLAMSTMTSAWPVGGAIALVLVASIFAQAGNGAIYAIVPLVRKQAGGQIAGMAGAYGNIGGIAFLSTLLFVTPRGFFLIMAGASTIVLICCRWLVEPSRNHGSAANVADAELATEPAAEHIAPEAIAV
ncbi:MAG: NarK family nitrate/nitrite MFS transporter [Acidimicrobiales bacterium]